MDKKNGAQYATNQDLKNTVESSKNELLEKLASKKELKQEVSKLAIKGELKNLEKRFEALTKKVEKNSADIVELRIEIVHMREDMKKLKIKEDADKKFYTLLHAIEGLAAKIDAYQAQKAATDHALQRHDNKLENHEKRIGKLEINKN